jgi:hypothetical protein
MSIKSGLSNQNPYPSFVSHSKFLRTSVTILAQRHEDKNAEFRSFSSGFFILSSVS